MVTGRYEKIGLDGAPVVTAVADASALTTGNVKPESSPVSSTEPAKSNNKTYLDLNLASHHFIDKTDPTQRVWNGRESKPYNEHNLGLGVTHMRQVWQSAGGDVSELAGASIGYYRNSLYRDSIYATVNAEATYRVTPTISAGVGAQVGVVTGYAPHAIPAGQIYARIEAEIPTGLRNMLPVQSAFLQVGLIPAVSAKQVSTPATATVRAGFAF